MKTLLKIFTNLSMASIIAVSLFTGCHDDSSDDLTIGPVESPFIICAGKNPGGVGIDVDSDTAYNIDDKADFGWDLRVKTYKGVLKNKSGKTAMSGAPFIKLQGTTVSAYKYSDNGTTDYDGIVLSDVVAGSLQADSVESLDMTSVDKVTQADIDADSSLAEFLGKFYLRGNSNFL